MPEEGEKDEDEDDDRIVHGEVGDVGFDASEEGAEGARRQGQGVYVGELAPWAACLES